MAKKGRTYTMERVVDQRFRAGTKEYFIKWKGYPSSQNTWEPAANILDKSVIIIYDQEQAALRAPAGPSGLATAKKSKVSTPAAADHTNQQSTGTNAIKVSPSKRSLPSSPVKTASPGLKRPRVETRISVPRSTTIGPSDTITVSWSIGGIKNSVTSFILPRDN